MVMLPLDVDVQSMYEETMRTVMMTIQVSFLLPDYLALTETNQQYTK